MTKDYYGTKRVTAWEQRETVTDPGQNPIGREGYAVQYADGYVSWSPKAVFEAAYKPVDAMDLSGALAAVKDGHTVTRADPEWETRGLTWNKSGLHNGLNSASSSGGAMLMNEDIFAEDWKIVDG